MEFSVNWRCELSWECLNHVIHSVVRHDVFVEIITALVKECGKPMQRIEYDIGIERICMQFMEKDPSFQRGIKFWPWDVWHPSKIFLQDGHGLRQWRIVSREDRIEVHAYQASVWLRWKPAAIVKLSCPSSWWARSKDTKIDWICNYDLHYRTKYNSLALNNILGKQL